MSEKRRSRFDPEYEGETGNLFEGFEDTDDEVMETPRRSRFEDDDRPLFGARKKKSVAFFDEKGEAFGNPEENDFDEDDFDGEYGKKRMPLFARLLIWLVLFVLIGAAGYFTADYFIGRMESKSLSEDPAVTARTDEKDAADKSVSSAPAVKTGKKQAEPAKTANTVQYRLYIPNGKDFTVRRVEIEHGRTEQDMERMLQMYFDSLREAGLSKNDVRIVNLFKSDSLAYLNLDNGFEKIISALDEKKAAEVITGLLSTLWNNFSVKKVKFYINGQTPDVKVPVDLSDQWGL